MIVGVPRETFPGERRVALVPAAIPNLKKAGLEVAIEAGAGIAGTVAGTDTKYPLSYYDCAAGVSYCGPRDTSLQGSAIVQRLALGFRVDEWEALAYTYFGGLHVVLANTGVGVGRSFGGL